MTSSSYPMCYIIDGTAKVSDPIFFNATTSFLLENKGGGVGGRHLDPF